MARTRVLDVGNCDPDHGVIRGMLEANFDATVDRVMFVHEALHKLRNQRYDLVLVNRLIFADGSPGLELVHQMKADPALAKTPVMLVSNYGEAQEQAVAAGAVPGFGKAGVGKPETLALIEHYLPRRRDAVSSAAASS